MKRLALALCLLAAPAYAADAPKQQPPPPQIQPTDQFSVTLPASAWENLVASTDSKALTNEITRQIREQFAKAHPAKK